MMKLLFLLLATTMGTTVYSQGFVGKTKEQVRAELGKYVAKEQVRVDFNEYDSLITFDIRDSTRKRVDFIYVFDQYGKCHTEIKVACDACIGRFLKGILKERKYKWVAQNDSVYHSNLIGGLKMEKLRKDTSCFLVIKKESQ